MRPVPMMVIWRIAIDFTTETRSHRERNLESPDLRNHHRAARSPEDTKVRLAFLRISVPLWWRQATLRPTAGAIMRNSSISLAN